jgi:hypothetical protein
VEKMSPLLSGSREAHPSISSSSEEEKAKERGEEKKEDGLIAGLMDSQVSTKPLLQSEPEEEEPAPENEPREQDAQQ